LKDNNRNSYKFSLSAILVYILLIVCFWRTTRLIGSFVLVDLIYPIQIIIFIFFVSITLDIKNLFNSVIFKLSFDKFLGLMIIIFFLLSVIKNYEQSDTLKILGYPITIILFYFFLPQYFYRNPYLLEKFFNIILVISFVSSITSVIGFLGLIDMNVSEFNSTIGIYHNPNTTPIIYIISIPILMYKFFEKKIKITWFILLTTLFAFCLLFTFSRAGYLGMCASILAFTYNKSKKIFIFSILLLLMSILLIGMDFAGSKGAGSAITRGTLWLTAWDMIFRDGNHTLWGYGITKSLKIFVEEKMYFGNMEVNVVEPHNFILFFSIQFGLLFTILILAFVNTILIKSTIIRNRIKEQKGLIILGVAVCIGFQFQNLFESYLAIYEFYAVPIFLFFLGYLNFIINLKKSEI
jgi:hypothetical protein